MYKRYLGAACSLLAQSCDFPIAQVLSVAHNLYLVLGGAAAQSLACHGGTLPKPLSAKSLMLTFIR